jgi:hypothetical protein
MGCRWVYDGVCARAEPPALGVVPSYTLATAHQGDLLAILFAVISGHVPWCTSDTRAVRRECATRVSCAPHFGTCLFEAAFDVRANYIGGVVTVGEYRAGKRWRRA